MVRILVGLRSSGGRYSSGILPIATSDRANRTLAPRASDLLWLWLRVLRPWLRGLGRGPVRGKQLVQGHLDADEPLLPVAARVGVRGVAVPDVLVDVQGGARFAEVGLEPALHPEHGPLRRARAHQRLVVDPKDVLDPVHVDRVGPDAELAQLLHLLQSVVDADGEPLGRLVLGGVVELDLQRSVTSTGHRRRGRLGRPRRPAEGTGFAGSLLLGDHHPEGRLGTRAVADVRLLDLRIEGFTEALPHGVPPLPLDDETRPRSDELVRAERPPARGPSPNALGDRLRLADGVGAGLG